MAESTLTVCVPLDIGGVTVAEIEATALICSPSPSKWEITIDGVSGGKVSLDDIQFSDRDADMKFALRDLIEDHLWAMQDDVQNALNVYRQGVRYRQQADAHTE